MVKKRRRHSAAYKLRIALEALEGSKTVGQFSSEHRDSCRPDTGLESARARRRAKSLLQPCETAPKSRLSNAGGRALRALFIAGRIRLNAPCFPHSVV